MAVKYDRSKNYSWNSEDEFTLKGREIEAIGLLVRVLQSEPEYKKFQLVQRLGESIDTIFERNINLLEEIPDK